MYSKNSILLFIFIISAFSLNAMRDDRAQKKSWWQAICAFFGYQKIIYVHTYQTDAYQTQGKNDYQQDRVIDVNYKGIPFWGIADGHGSPMSECRNELKQFCASNIQCKNVIIRQGVKADPTGTYFDEGATAADYVAEKVPTHIAQHLSDESFIARVKDVFRARPIRAIYNSVKQGNKGLKDLLDLCKANNPVGYEQSSKYPGSTFAMAFPWKDKLWCMHSGDSRMVVLDNNKESIYSSRDHKPNDPQEKMRIEKCGGQVDELKNSDGSIRGYRIYPDGLAVSRSFGDFTARCVTVHPTIATIPLQKVKTIIVASDGVTDYLDMHDGDNKKPLNSTLLNLFKTTQFSPGIAKSLVALACITEGKIRKQNWKDEAEALSKAHDNASAIVVDFQYATKRT